MHSYKKVLICILVLALIPACVADVDPKITGGDDTGRGNFPYIAWVMFDGKMICSGALLNKDFVITVASCLPERERLDPKRFRVVLGDYRQKRMRDGEVSIIPERIIPHPDFGMDTDLNNNIALIQLSKPAPVKRLSIEAVQRLSTSNRDMLIKANKASQCVAVGWGYEKKENGVMQKVDVFFTKDSDCDTSGYDDGEHICYKTTKGTSCDDDEGLIVSCFWRKKWTLIGLQSMGRCNGGVMIGTKVSTFRKWIRKAMLGRERALGLQWGEACRITGQCLNDLTVCDRGSCACFSGYQLHKGVCYREGALGEDCQVSTQCIGMNEMCRDGLCSCKPKSVEVEGKCFLEKNLNASCRYTAQCLGTTANSECESNTCQCESGYRSSTQLVAEGACYRALSFASYYGDHMVLQKSPKRSQIWGYAATLGDTVTVELSGHKPVTTQVEKHEELGMIWLVLLPAEEEPGPFTISVSSSEGHISLIDVLFGDLWLCSGQSNMQFTLSMPVDMSYVASYTHHAGIAWRSYINPFTAKGYYCRPSGNSVDPEETVFNASEEIADAVDYPAIRLFTVAQKWSNNSEYDLLQVEQHWSIPDKDSVGHSNWSYFSAVCWLYGKYLQQHLQYPIGLISTNWGGTPVESWSSPEAIDTCSEPETQPGVERGLDVPEQNKPSKLWNSMIHPFLNLTIYGAIWYQGEANAAKPDRYKCQFPIMIDDWRKKFNEGSSGQTDSEFPFGFVQLAPWRNDSSITQGFPDIRWHQTCDFGYAPNPQMHNTFMAVAMDLPDFSSPYNSIHPRDKQDVASRLVLSALPVAYNMSAGLYQGPQISAFFIDIGFFTLRIELDSGKTPIQVRSNGGFEVCCSSNNQSKCDGTDSKWSPAPIIQHDTTSVTMSYKDGCANTYVMGLRYAWRESPCLFKQCAVYTVENELPMAPFVTLGLIGAPLDIY